MRLKDEDEAAITRADYAACFFGGLADGTLLIAPLGHIEVLFVLGIVFWDALFGFPPYKPVLLVSAIFPLGVGCFPALLVGKEYALDFLVLFFRHDASFTALDLGDLLFLFLAHLRGVCETNRHNGDV